MKKKVLNLIMIIILILILFVLSGCSNNIDNKEILLSNEQAINTLEQEKNNNINIVGEWEATKTNDDNYSLGWLYGTSLSFGNKLKFNNDNTYSLGLGVTYWQEGKYEIDGTIIKLTETEYKGDNPDKKIVNELQLDDEQIILVETEGSKKIKVIFTNINNSIKDVNPNIPDTNNKTIISSTEATNKELKIDKKTIKFGSYTGIDAATGDTLVIKNDNTATLNGINYTYEVGNYNFSQDSSSDSYQNGIIFKNNDGSVAFSLYIGNDGSLRDDPMAYIYSEN